ncbi:hypothetical protein ACFYKT_09210 [Cytobacillus sp. FJAT-53684]|uniref:Phage protein n=1 Tax=Cytobacillus mangrovibacter TaxID=3299024 RepID=A0ABW6K0I8_9BACI
MNKDELDHKKFLEEQLEWCKKQDRIFGGIDMKLSEMKKIAEYALQHELTSAEIEDLNVQLSELKNEVDSLEKQLHSSVVH